MKLLLGPILGIESESTYTIVFVSNEENNFQLVWLFDGVQKRSFPQIVKKLDSGVYYRFIIQIDLIQKEQQCKYWIENQIGEQVSNKYSDLWMFSIPGEKDVPRIYSCSCNGITKKDPDKYSPEDIERWKELIKTHDQYPGHILIMTGDQVYADSLWETIPYFDKIEKTLKDKNLLANHQISGKNLSDLRSQLNFFYENLYFKSWGYEAMAKAMASIPSIMIWDDHDIFDGYGSHEIEIQESQIVSEIYRTAEKYFSLFQIRTKKNVSLINPNGNHFASNLHFRNFEILVFDGRSQRTTSQVHSNDQYNEIKLHFNKISNIETNMENPKQPKVLLVVTAVPVSHFYYTGIIREAASWKGKNDFRKASKDDTIDQWSHPNHKLEHKQFLDMLCNLGDALCVEYVCILSGDVHSGGVARAFSDLPNEHSKINEAKYHCISQIISSPMVHSSHSWIQKNLLLLLTRSVSKIEGYELKIKNFGDSGSKTIHEKNFVVIYKKENRGLEAFIYSESLPSKKRPNHNYMIPKFYQDQVF